MWLPGHEVLAARIAREITHDHIYGRTRERDASDLQTDAGLARSGYRDRWTFGRELGPIKQLPHEFKSVHAIGVCKWNASEGEMRVARRNRLPCDLFTSLTTTGAVPRHAERASPFTI